MESIQRIGRVIYTVWVINGQRFAVSLCISVQLLEKEINLTEPHIKANR